MNLPIMPGQNNSGKNGASVVKVPASTGTNTSPAAIFAAMVEDSFPLPCTNMRCVFSITTIASSTIIPNPNSNANSTIKFSVTGVPMMISATGKNTNATNMLSGTESATKNAFTTPMKNMRMISTSTKPITMELTKSLKDVLVLVLKSPVTITERSLGQ